MVFPELRRDSRVTTGNSGCLLCWPRQVQSSIRVAKESWALPSSDCRANRPHLGLCPEANVPLHGGQGSRGCIPDAPGETGIHLEWRHARALSSQAVAAVSRFSSHGSRDLWLSLEAFLRDFPTGLSHVPPWCESILGLKVETVQGKQVSLEWTEASGGLWEWWHDPGVPLACPVESASS